MTVPLYTVHNAQELARSPLVHWLGTRYAICMRYMILNCSDTCIEHLNVQGVMCVVEHQMYSNITTILITTKPVYDAVTSLRK